MRDWLTQALLDSATRISEDASCYVVGRGLPSRLTEEIRIGTWVCPEDPPPDEDFNKRHGLCGMRVEGWISIPLWTPRGRVIGVEFRRWDGEKEVMKYHLPDSDWAPVFTGMVPSTLNKIWAGGDVWLVEGIFDLSISHVVPSSDAILSCGGAKITNQQIDFLKRFLSPNSMVHICFDMDETGRNMANGYVHPDTGKRIWGVTERLSKVGIRNRVVRYGGGKDPGEIWEAGGKSMLKTSLGFK